MCCGEQCSRGVSRPSGVDVFLILGLLDTYFGTLPEHNWLMCVCLGFEPTVCWPCCDMTSAVPRDC